MPLSVVTQTRGDARRLAEWVTYHARIGFEEFHVILDGLVDDSDEVLAGLDVGARIEVYRYPEEGVYCDGLSQVERDAVIAQWRCDNAEALAALPYSPNDPQSWRQRERVSEVLGRITEGRRGWVAHFDADEFIHLPGGGTVRDLVRAARTPRLQFHSLDVDTTGHDPSRPVLSQHRTRWDFADLEAHPDARWASRVKAMVQYRKALPLRSLHRISYGPHDLLDLDVARIHHYRTPTQRSVDPPLPYTVDDPLTMPPQPR